MTEKPKCRWYQFSMRTLLVFVTLCAICCSWLGVNIQQARKQQRAATILSEAGAWVFYDYEVDESWMLHFDKEPPTATWLQQLFGADFFSDVVLVSGGMWRGRQRNGTLQRTD